MIYSRDIPFWSETLDTHTHTQTPSLPFWEVHTWWAHSKRPKPCKSTLCLHFCMLDTDTGTTHTHSHITVCTHTHTHKPKHTHTETNPLTFWEISTHRVCSMPYAIQIIFVLAVELAWNRHWGCTHTYAHTCPSTHTHTHRHTHTQTTYTQGVHLRCQYCLYKVPLCVQYNMLDADTRTASMCSLACTHPPTPTHTTFSTHDECVLDDPCHANQVRFCSWAHLMQTLGLHVHLCVRTHSHTHAQTHTHTCTNTHIHTHTHAQTHTHTHTHTHSQTHTHTHSWPPQVLIPTTPKNCSRRSFGSQTEPPHWPCGKASTSRVADLGSTPTSTTEIFLDRVFQSRKNWYFSGYPARCLQYRVSLGTGWLGVRILRLGEIASPNCNFYLSVAACKSVRDLSLRYTSTLLGC